MMNDDTLESLLKNADRETLPSEISSAELAMSVRRQHAEWRRRRDGRIRGAVLVGCYFAGALSMWSWSKIGENHSADRRFAESIITSRPVTRDGKETAAPPLDQKDSPIQAVPVVDVETETPYERYRRLGDVALMQDRNVNLAVEFYRRALGAASKTEGAVAFAGDSWVMIQLKQGQSNTTL